MTTSAERITTVAVSDPRTVLKQHRVQPIIKGGQQVTYAHVDSSSVDNNSISWTNVNPPSGGTIVDRKVLLTVPVRLLINGTVTGANNSTCLQAGFDSLRSFPLSGSVQTLTVTVNNQSVSVPMGSIIHPLEHYNVDSKLKKSDYSMTPTAYDPCTDYGSLSGGVNNPMNFYLDNKEGTPQSRGAFPMNIVLNTAANNGANVSAIVDFVITEPLFISPFFFGQRNASGFYNVTTMSIALQMAGNYAYRMWSHLNSGNNNGVDITSVSAFLTNFESVPGANNTGFTLDQQKPTAQFTYITPQDTQKLSPFESLSYPFFNIQQYLTPYAALATGNTLQLTTNNIQLSSIPRRMFLFARPSDNTLYSAAGVSLPDCYCSIENVSIQFQNTTGILSSATKQQLYMLSTKNGCDMDYIQWSGGPTQAPGDIIARAAGSHPGSVFTIGSVLCLEFGTDIALPSVTDAPGKLGQYNLQIQAKIKNNFSVQIDPTFYIVVVSEGTFTIDKLGVASVHLGDLTSNDILEATGKDDYTYYDLQDLDGGSWFDGLKKGFMMPFNWIKKGTELVKPLKDAVGLMGMGIHTGGATVSYSDLKDRLSVYN